MIAQADAFRIPLPNQSVHCAVTSPPYWGLRKYAGDQGRIWGGDPECEHEWESTVPIKTGRNDGGQTEWTGIEKTGWGGQSEITSGSLCGHCGAWYGSLGLEPTPEQHTENIVEICREVRRVLRDDGVFWLNYGDSYTAQGGHTVVENDGRSNRSQRQGATGARVKGLAQGNLMMMPHRVALALQADGWIVRQDLVWFKRNPMPESVNGWRWQRERTKTKTGDTATGRLERQPGRASWTVYNGQAMLGVNPEGNRRKDLNNPEYEYGDDLELRKGSWRHTRAHEYVFQLVKSMGYWSNQEAVRETGTSGPSDIRKMEQGLDRIGGKNKELIDPLARASATTKLGQKRAVGDPSSRNPRSVLDVPTAPYRGAHYATFPPNLIAPLIRATCPRWACPVCGQGWAAVVEQQFVPQSDVSEEKGVRGHDGQKPMDESSDWQGSKRGISGSRTLGYRPTCSHEHTQEEAVPGIVFDPFVGSGTTVKVAQDLLRKGIGIDISMEYLDLQAKVRIGQGSPSNQLENLPLFDGLEPPLLINKQDSLGKRTYTGFNERWDAQHK